MTNYKPKVTEYFEKKRIRKVALGRMLNLCIHSILGYPKNCTIQTAILWDLSTALSHNFFMDLAVLMPKEFTTEVDLFLEKNQKIAQVVCLGSVASKKKAE